MVDYFEVAKDLVRGQVLTMPVQPKERRIGPRRDAVMNETTRMLDYELAVLVEQYGFEIIDPALQQIIRNLYIKGVARGVEMMKVTK